MTDSVSSDLECPKCSHQFKTIYLGLDRVNAPEQLNLHLELDCGLFADCLNYLLFARTTEEDAMNTGNIEIVYIGETANQGLVRPLAFMAGLAQVGKVAGEVSEEDLFTRAVFEETLAKDNVYLMVVRRSSNYTEVKNSEYSCKFD